MHHQRLDYWKLDARMPRKWLPWFPTAAVVGALIGMAVGLGAGVVVSHGQDYAEAGLLAELWVARADEISAEATSTLAQINASPDPMCSDADITRLRQIVIGTRFIKSAARIYNHQLFCTSTLGRVNPPSLLPKSDFTSRDGYEINLKTQLHGIPGVDAMVLQMGTARVAISHNTYAFAVDSRLDYFGVGMTAPNDQRFVFMQSNTIAPTVVSQMPLQSGRPIDIGDKRFEVRCSNVYPGCIVARLKEPSMLSHSPVFIGFGIFGLLAGLGVGLWIRALLARSRSLDRRLHAAVRSGALTVMYQPIIRLADRHWSGAEALARWNDGGNLPVSPDLFIAVAEQYGFVSEVTQCVLAKTLEELAPLMKADPKFHVTVNISAMDLLDPDFPAAVQSKLAAAGVAPTSIGFELTERSTAAHTEIAAGIAILRERGHKVYIDDFGTDYSSLSYLAELNVDAVKLDQTFCKGLPEDEKLGLIAQQIVAMVHGLGLELIVEGIEHAPQARYFDELSSTAYGQGWLFAKAMPAAQFISRYTLRSQTTRAGVSGMTARGKIGETSGEAGVTGVSGFGTE